MQGLVLILLVAATWGAPRPGGQDHLATILSHHHTDEGDGHFQYDFDTSNGINVQAEGTPGVEGQNIRGSFRYPLPDGTIVEVHYVADENGYTIEYPIIHSLHPLPARPEDPHDHDDPLHDIATHDPLEDDPLQETATHDPLEDDLPDSHDEDHGTSDSHIDNNVTASDTHLDPATHDTHEDSADPSHTENDLPESHDEDHGTLDSHIDNSLIASHIHLDSHTPTDSHTHDSHSPDDSHTHTDSHTPDDSHSATDHTDADTSIDLRLDLRSGF